MKPFVKIPPFALPLIFFAVVIGIGGTLLHLPVSSAGEQISLINSFFTATSAVCVTGLVVLDTGTAFSVFGQTVILFLIQVGGLGIMTFTGLAFYLWRQKVSLTDRVAIGQTLLHDPAFHIGKFLFRLVFWALLIESIGAFLIYLQLPQDFPAFSSLFHAVSAFCNAGFSLHASSLMKWQTHLGLNLTIMALIILGGIGFSVLVETQSVIANRIPRSAKKNISLSWYARIVIRTSVILIVAGWIGIYLAEYISYTRAGALDGALLSCLFQSVTSRTAGFNTVDIGQMTNISLLIILFLMFIGGAPGSCAGGIKITSFRTLLAFAVAQIRGERQVVVGKFAIDEETVKNALTLLVFSILILVMAVLLLDITEGGDIPHTMARGQFLDILFEAVSAFCTVGLSTGLTPKLSHTGKYVIIALMFIGRLGPLVVVAGLQWLKKEKYYARAEERFLIG